jgi:hypothetical protein
MKFAKTTLKKKGYKSKYLDLLEEKIGEWIIERAP